jgi:hypothetical protein
VETAGRGASNRRTLAHREFWSERMNSEDYRESRWKRILRGHANHMEIYLAATILGPRKQQVEVSGGLDLVARLKAGRERFSRGETPS